eukprot:gene7131-9614_t
MSGTRPTSLAPDGKWLYFASGAKPKEARCKLADSGGLPPHARWIASVAPEMPYGWQGALAFDGCLSDRYAGKCPRSPRQGKEAAGGRHRPVQRQAGSLASARARR